eukprot:COSAG01_NODE_25553_length_741_cov_0.911215_2_plen_65_part_01
MPDLCILLLDLYKVPYITTDIQYDADGTAREVAVVVQELMCSTMVLHSDNWLKHNARMLGYEHYD